MWRIIRGLLEDRRRTMTRRLAGPALAVVVAMVFVLIAIVALSAALFLWLTPVLGAVQAALVLAVAAVALAGIALLPVALKRHPPPEPAAQPAGVDFAALLPLVSSILKLRPLLLGALLVALFATLTSKPTDSGDIPED
jgi:hypothetical protein